MMIITIIFYVIVNIHFQVATIFCPMLSIIKLHMKLKNFRKLSFNYGNILAHFNKVQQVNNYNDEFQIIYFYSVNKST